VGSSERETRCDVANVHAQGGERDAAQRTRPTTAGAGIAARRVHNMARASRTSSGQRTPHYHARPSSTSLIINRLLHPRSACLSFTRARKMAAVHTHTSSKRMKEKMCGTHARRQRQHIVQLCGIRLAAGHVVTPLPRVAVVESDACACPATPSHTHFPPPHTTHTTHAHTRYRVRLAGGGRAKLPHGSQHANLAQTGRGTGLESTPTSVPRGDEGTPATTAARKVG
jgi:hypothetical protein